MTHVGKIDIWKMLLRIWFFPLLRFWSPFFRGGTSPCYVSPICQLSFPRFEDDPKNLARWCWMLETTMKENRRKNRPPSKVDIYLLDTSCQSWILHSFSLPRSLPLINHRGDTCTVLALHVYTYTVLQSHIRNPWKYISSYLFLCDFFV